MIKRVHPAIRHSPFVGAMAEYWIYFQAFLRSASGMASIAPSSRWTARAMVQGLEQLSGGAIVELGAGTGAITAELLRVTAGRCRCLIVERDPQLCRRLRERFRDAEIVEGDALNFDAMLRERRIRQIDHVLCELPMNWFAPPDRDNLLADICRWLKPAGSFRQLSHLHWLGSGQYRCYFREVTTRHVLRNVPPAGCFICRSPIHKPLARRLESRRGGEPVRLLQR